MNMRFKTGQMPSLDTIPRKDLIKFWNSLSEAQKWQFVIKNKADIKIFFDEDDMYLMAYDDYIVLHFVGKCRAYGITALFDALEIKHEIAG